MTHGDSRQTQLRKALLYRAAHLQFVLKAAVTLPYYETLMSHPSLLIFRRTTGNAVEYYR